MPTKLALPLLLVLRDESGRYVMTNASVSDPNSDLYYTYEYDTYGNIRSAEAHGSYHTSDNYTNDYEYNNPKWLDLLTGFNTEPILYEGQTLVDGEIVGDPTSGNPISYYNGTRWEFVWQNGRQLASASATEGDTTINIAYTYDLNGLRTSKTITRTTTTDSGDEGGSTTPVPDCDHDLVEVERTAYMITYRCTKCGATVQEPIQVDPPSTDYGLERSVESVETERHEYIYASGQLLREVVTTTDAEGAVTTEVLDLTYDASGSPYALTYTNDTASPVTYYYVVNLQGDVIRLVSGTGATVAEYAYDPYGRVISATGTMAEVNPLRYRGYCYDAETEFYYLQSRYYDPVICRFVNADGYASTGQGFLGQNMFAYCNNRPTCAFDPTGYALTASYWVALPDYVACEPEDILDTVKEFGMLVFGDITTWDNMEASGVEWGIVLYSYTDNYGKTYYRACGVQYGFDGAIDICYNPKPFGENSNWKICGNTHTHPDGSPPSIYDREAHAGHRDNLVRDADINPETFTSFVITRAYANTFYIYAATGYSKNFHVVGLFTIPYDGGDTRRYTVADVRVN